jgi:hypothetical protein
MIDGQIQAFDRHHFQMFLVRRYDAMGISSLITRSEKTVIRMRKSEERKQEWTMWCVVDDVACIALKHGSSSQSS